MIVTITFEMYAENSLVSKVILLSDYLRLLGREAAHFQIQMIDIFVAIQEFNEDL
jgi:hypothetical protein